MSNNYENPAFKKLLQKLQEESWQLELIISGFAIFGLFSAFPELNSLGKEASNNNELIKTITIMVAFVSCAILLFNLLLHVVLRGLWIGALGLRYVSGDIDYDELKYSPKFTNYLKKKIGSFDKYIATLENYCSVIFAISFLLIFYVLAFTFTLTTIGLTIEYIIENESLPIWVSKGVGNALAIFMVLGMVLTFIDFITQGWLKKKQWLSKIYFPVYWVFSFFTLSFLYRPLVYNFLDNKFGKRISFILVPVYFIILLGTSLEYRKSNYIEKSNTSSSYYASEKNYEDMLTEEGEFIKIAAIPSKVIKGNFLKVFITYTEAIEDRIFSVNESLKPKKDKRGLYSKLTSSRHNVNIEQRDSLKQVYLKTFNEVYRVIIDSTQYTSKFILGESNTLESEFGFETYIALDSLKQGKRLLKLQRDEYKEKDTTIVTFSTIPFWYFKG